MMTKRAAAFILGLALPGCLPQLQPPDPDVVAQVNYVCAYSGAFKFADTTAAKVIPVPGAPFAVDLVNMGVDQVCLHPEVVGVTVATVRELIASFRTKGLM